MGLNFNAFLYNADENLAFAEQKHILNIDDNDIDGIVDSNELIPDVFRAVNQHKAFTKGAGFLLINDEFNKRTLVLQYENIELLIQRFARMSYWTAHYTFDEWDFFEKGMPKILPLGANWAIDYMDNIINLDKCYITHIHIAFERQLEITTFPQAKLLNASYYILEGGIVPTEQLVDDAILRRSAAIVAEKWRPELRVASQYKSWIHALNAQHRHILPQQDALNPQHFVVHSKGNDIAPLSIWFGCEDGVNDDEYKLIIGTHFQALPQKEKPPRIRD